MWCPAPTHRSIARTLENKQAGTGAYAHIHMPTTPRARFRWFILPASLIHALVALFIYLFVYFFCPQAHVHAHSCSHNYAGTGRLTSLSNSTSHAFFKCLPPTHTCVPPTPLTPPSLQDPAKKKKKKRRAPSIASTEEPEVDENGYEVKRSMLQRAKFWCYVRWYRFKNR